MALIETLKSTTKRSWPILSAVVAIGSFAFAIYTSVHERTPAVTLDIVSEANILDVHRPMPELSVLFNGENLAEKNLNLKVLLVRVQNTGELDIRQSDYDQQEDWGFRVDGGRLVRATLVEAHSDYLRSHLAPDIRTGGDIKLQKVILERSDYALLELLVIHAKDRAITLQPFGKIAGVARIGVVRSSPSAGRPSFWAQLKEGSIPVQIVRAVLAITGFVVGIVIAVLVGSAGSDSRSRRLREARRKRLDRLQLTATTPAEKAALELYVDEGLDALRAILTHSTGPPIGDHIVVQHSDGSRSVHLLAHLSRKLQDAGAATWTPGTVTYAPAFLKVVKELVEAEGLKD